MLLQYSSGVHHIIPLDLPMDLQSDLLEPVFKPRGQEGLMGYHWLIDYKLYTELANYSNKQII